MPELTDHQRTMIQAVLDGKKVQNFWRGTWETLEPDEAVRFIAGWNSDDGALRIVPQPIELWNWLYVSTGGVVASGHPHPDKVKVEADAQETWRSLQRDGTIFLVHTVIDRETHSLGITSSIIQ